MDENTTQNNKNETSKPQNQQSAAIKLRWQRERWSYLETYETCLKALQQTRLNKAIAETDRETVSQFLLYLQEVLDGLHPGNFIERSFGKFYKIAVKFDKEEERKTLQRSYDEVTDFLETGKYGVMLDLCINWLCQLLQWDTENLAPKRPVGRPKAS